MIAGRRDYTKSIEKPIGIGVKVARIRDSMKKEGSGDYTFRFNGGTRLTFTGVCVSQDVDDVGFELLIHFQLQHPFSG